jgi:hypothetical protein
MATPYTNNNLVDQILLDLSNIVNEKYGSADESIERLGGLLIQPTSFNSQQERVAYGYFTDKGASKEAAQNLTLIVSNLSKITGISIAKIVRQIESAEDIAFTEDLYIQINNIRHKESQWFKAQPTYNDRSLFRVNCNCPAPSGFFIVKGDNHVISDWPYLTVFEWVSEAKLTTHIVSDYDTISLTGYDSDATWAISLTLFSTTLYPVDAVDSVEMGGALSYGYMMEMPIDEVAMGYSMHDGTYEQVIWYIEYGPDVDEVAMGFDLVDGTLINKLVEADSPDESLQLGCAMDSSSSMTPV